MAEVATSPAAEKPTADAPQGKQQVVKPDKPDEEKYKQDLEKAEKEHAAAQEKLVSRISPSNRPCACAFNPAHAHAHRIHRRMHQN